MHYLSRFWQISLSLAVGLHSGNSIAHAQASTGLLQNGCSKGFLEVIFGEGNDKLDMDSEVVALGLYNAECTILGMIQFFIDIAGVVALFMFVYGGVQMFFALRQPGGDPSGDSKKTFYRAAMGLILMVMAHIIIGLVMGTFMSFTPGG